MALLTNLTGQSIGAVLTTSQIQIFLSRGAFCDYTVRQGVISGMSNGTPLTGSGGIITPSSFDETTLTGKGPEDYTTQTEIGTPEVFTTVSAAGSDNPGTSDAQSVPAVVLNPESEFLILQTIARHHRDQAPAGAIDMVHIFARTKF